MKARPIIFSGAMVRALLEGRKTQTRRVVKNPDWYGCTTGDCPHGKQAECDSAMAALCPHGQLGDLLWVRETYGVGYPDGQGGYSAIPWTASNPERDGKAFYKADYPAEQYSRPWKSSRYMPRWASRLTLKLTDVRVERVRDISEDDAKAEGARAAFSFPGWDGVSGQPCYQWGFHELWDSINAKRGYSWDSNPFVWRLEFEVIQQNVDQVMERAE